MSRWRQNRVLGRGWGAKVSGNFTHAHRQSDRSASKPVMRRNSSKLAPDLLPNEVDPIAGTTWIGCLVGSSAAPFS